MSPFLSTTESLRLAANPNHDVTVAPFRRLIFAAERYYAELNLYLALDGRRGTAAQKRVMEMQCHKFLVAVVTYTEIKGVEIETDDLLNGARLLFPLDMGFGPYRKRLTSDPALWVKAKEVFARIEKRIPGAGAIDSYMLSRLRERGRTLDEAV